MKFLIWDLPTRLFHWLFAGSAVMAFIIAKVAEKETPIFYLHVVFGVLAGLLVLWRIIWGFIGSRHSRWKELFFSPASVINYFKEVSQGRGIYYAGHNPGGSLAILGLLALVFFTVLSGIFIAKAEVFEELHEVLPVILMIVSAIHIVGVLLATKMHKENYALSMITGRRKGTAADAISQSHGVAAAVMLVAVLGSWAYFIKGFDRNSALFTAPGTQWSFQVGEPEENENKQGGESASEQDDDDEGYTKAASAAVKKDEEPAVQSESDKDGDDD